MAVPQYAFQGVVKLSNGSQQTVVVMANNSSNAKAMMESQYGKVVSGPFRK